MKLLDECGIYQMFGREISNYRSLGLNEDKIYIVRKTSEYIKALAKTIKKQPVYDKDKSTILGKVKKHIYVDGMVFVDVPKGGFEEIAARYEVEARFERGFEFGVVYDLVLINPKLDSVVYVEARRSRISA